MSSPRVEIDLTEQGEDNHVTYSQDHKDKLFSNKKVDSLVALWF